MSKSISEKLFSKEEDLSPEEQKKKDYENKVKTNPFIIGPKGKNEDPKYGTNVDPKYGEKELHMFRDSMTASVEESYFWYRRFMEKGDQPQSGAPKGFGMNMHEVIKLKDVFDASVSSSFHGQIGTKISAIQQQVSNTLQQIGQLVKTLFPIVREIRIMDERLEFYKKSFCEKPTDEARENEITLKSTWVEVVEQGMQNPNSVYSMATKLGFVTLPDLFFAINPHGMTPEEQQQNLTKTIAKIRKEKEINKKVTDALSKKLTQYYTWKSKTYQEMQHTWKFRIKNLRQHYNVIRLYMSWLKPYLTTLKQLQMKQDVNSPDLISAFETSKLEMELLGVITRKKTDKFHPCVLVKFLYTTRPDLTYTSSGQKQPTHAGLTHVWVQPYIATDEEIDFYKEYTEKELLKYFTGGEFDMIQGIEDAMSSLGTDVEEYLREAETGKREKEEVKKETNDNFFEPFTALLSSFSMFVPDLKKKEGEKEWSPVEIKENRKKAEKTASGRAWLLYDVYKKAHGMYNP
ncbi:MAG: hypothetical protein ABIJ18_00875 [archaeon]